MFFDSTKRFHHFTKIRTMGSLRFFLVLGILLVGAASPSSDQYSASGGGLYIGRGSSVVAPGYGPIVGYPNNDQNSSNTSYLAALGVVSGQYEYSPGYSGYAAPQQVYRMGPNRPCYGAYGYGNYSDGFNDGYPLFRPAYRSRRFR